MPHEELLSAVIGEIYDAGLDPGRWPRVLEVAARFIGGTSAMLFSKTGDDKPGLPPDLFVVEHGIAPRYSRLYLDQYIKLDPAPTGHYTPAGAATTRRIFERVEEPITVTDLISYEGFLQTRFYREWAEPQGVVDFVGAVLDNSVPGAAMWGVFRHIRDGVADAGARERMRLVAPHVRRALVVNRLLAARTAQAGSFAAAFDGLTAGIIVVAAAGDILYVNRVGRAVLRAGDVLAELGGRLAAADGEVDEVLRAALCEAAAGAAPLRAAPCEAGGAKAAAERRKDTTVSLLGRDGARYVAHILPLASRARLRAGVAPAAAVFIHTAALDQPSSGAIAQAYRLTPTELRVLLALIDIGGVPDVAAALGVGEVTVRSHLRRLFQKTGARRQADLVKLVAGFANPLMAE